MVGKLAVVAAGMFAFGYALVPLYRAICEVTGINILSLSELQVPGGAKGGAVLVWILDRGDAPGRAAAQLDEVSLTTR